MMDADCQQRKSSKGVLSATFPGIIGLIQAICSSTYYIPLLLISWIHIAWAQEPIKITVSPQEQKVADHGIATFLCDTNLMPVPTIYWRRNGRRLNYGPHYQMYRKLGGSALRIEPVRAKRDDALFECVVEDGIHEPVSDYGILRVYPKAQIFMHKSYKGYPKIKEHPSLKVVEEDNYCVMVCTAAGDPEPRIQWLKDYVPVEMGTYRYIIIDQGSLQIAYVQDTDDGTYECIAQNELGVAYSDPARLIVEEYNWPD